MTAASRSVTLTPQGHSASRFRKAMRVAMLTVSGLLIPVAMQVPSVRSKFELRLKMLGHRPLLVHFGRFLSVPECSLSEIPAPCTSLHDSPSCTTSRTNYAYLANLLEANAK